MRIMNALLVAALVSGLAAQARAQQHDLFKSYPDSRLDTHDVKEFDEIEVGTGQFLDGRYLKKVELEGKLTVLRYQNPPQRSTLELMRNYETSLKQTGFQTLFSCKGNACGTGCVQTKGLGHFCAQDEGRFWVGKLPREGGDAYLSLHVDDNWTRVSVVEVKPMDAPLTGAAPTAAPAAAPKPAPEAPVAATPAAPALPAPTGSGKGPEYVETGVISGLNKFGFQTKAGKPTEAADIVVEGKVNTEPLTASGDTRWKWARSSATVSVKDGKTGKIFLRFDATDRQASGDYKEAARRSQAELAQKVSTQVQSAITEYFENQ